LSWIVHQFTDDERIRAMSCDIVIAQEVVITEHRVIITKKVMTNPVTDGSSEFIKSISFVVVCR